MTATISLCGFPVSNYYNKVKFALLEKGITFNEEFVHPKSITEEQRKDSPLGKVPYLKTPHGSLCESQVILEYLEAIAPSPALVPNNAFEAAKMRELCTFIDLHLELVVRDLYAEAFFGGTVSDSSKERVRKLLSKNIPAFMGLAKFSPMVAGGEQLTFADCCAWVTLPLVGMATKIIYGEDMLIAMGCDYKPYIQRINERESAQRVTADRKASMKTA